MIISLRNPKKNKTNNEGIGSQYKDLLTIVIVYTVAHIGIVLSAQAVFWDDWVIYNHNLNQLVEAATLGGRPWDGYLYFYFMKMGLHAVRIWTFFAHLLSSIFLYYILKNGTSLNREASLFIVIFFSVSPFFLSRVAIVLVWYTTAYFLFFYAWFLSVLSIQNKKKSIKYLSVLCFLLSFTTPSLLVFYIFPFLHILILTNLENHSLNVNVLLKKNYLYLLIPFVFYIVKTALFSPTGEYTNYNAIDLDNLVQRIYTPLLIVRNYFRHIIDLDKLLLTCSVGFFYYMVYLLRPGSPSGSQAVDYRTSAKLVFAGIIIYLVGLFPYMLVNKTALFYDWVSRHQLLLPLGFALFAAGFTMLISKKMRLFIVSLIAGSSIAFCINSYYSYGIDWIKQEALVKIIRNNKNIKTGTTFTIVDMTKRYNAKQRFFRIYEYNGILKQAFDGEETRLGSEDIDYNNWPENFFTTPEYRNRMVRYNMSDYVPKPIDCKVVIDYGDYLLSFGNLFRLLVIKYWGDSNEYNIHLGNVLDVSCKTEKN